MGYCRSSKRVGIQATVVALVCLFYLDHPWNPLNKIDGLEDPKHTNAKAGEEEAGKEGEEEEDVQIPDEMPEDAIFVPLGLARQLPQTFYKGTDPEWQSFIAFSKDKKRNQAVRSTLGTIPLINYNQINTKHSL